MKMSWQDILKRKPYGHNLELTYENSMFLTNYSTDSTEFNPIIGDKISVGEPAIPKSEYHRAKVLLYVIQLEEGEAKAKSKLAYLRDTGIIPYDYVMDKYDSGEYTVNPKKLPNGEKIDWTRVE
tara:strand:+ start:990 stop:1361 length:372 start_codon:yes stop_codon:yes gene_type:complete